MRTPGSGEPGAMTEAEGKELQKAIQDAVNQGQIVQAKLRGNAAGGASLSGMTQCTTDWKGPLRRFVSELCEGDDQSRYCPPNKLLRPLDIILPSRFSEATGEIVIACDTSGSMGGVYPVVFGEVARICQQVRPSSVRIIWWDTEIAGVQRFTEKDYDRIATALAPKGGGGTRVSVVARYIKENKIKPKAIVYLSDGYIESNYEVPEGPVLWGVVDNAAFVPRRGKKVDICSATL